MPRMSTKRALSLAINLSKDYSARAVQQSKVIPREEHAYNAGWQDAIQFVREQLFEELS